MHYTSFPYIYMYIELWKLKVCAVFAKSAVQATGIAELTHAKIVCNMVQLHAKSTQKTQA